MTIIERVASEYGISPAECRTAIQELISQTWATSNPEKKNRQIQLVGDSHIPSPEELILLISQKALDN